MISFWELCLEHIPALLVGLRNSMILALMALSIGFMLGLLLSLFRVYGPAPFRLLSSVYISFTRGTPLLTQLFILYFGLPSVGITMTPFTAAVIGFGLNSAAYQAEYFRGSIWAIEPGQLLGARAIGMTRIQTILFIVLPQVLRLVIPAWSNEIIILIKFSSLAYLIQYPELLFQTRYIASRNFRMFEMLIMAAILYLASVLIATFILRRVEARVRIPGLGTGVSYEE